MEPLQPCSIYFPLSELHTQAQVKTVQRRQLTDKQQTSRAIYWCQSTTQAGTMFASLPVVKWEKQSRLNGKGQLQIRNH